MSLSFGRLIASGLGFLIGVIISRGMGPHEFGRYSLVMGVFEVTVVFSSIGLGTAIVRFVSHYLPTDKPKAEYYLMISFWLMLSVSSIVAFAGYFLAPFIAADLYNQPTLTTPLRLGFVAIVAGSLWSLLLSNLQAREQFKTYALLSVVTNIAKLTAVASLYFFKVMDVVSLLIVQVAAPAFGVLLGNRKVPVKLKGLVGSLQPTLRELFSFSKWIFVVDLSVILFSRLDILMLGYYVDEAIVGHYAVAFTVVYALTVLTSSLGNVLLPMVSRLTGVHQFKSYMKKVIPMSFLLCLLISPVYYLIDPVIRLLFGEAYLPAIVIFRIMFVGVLFNLLVEPLYLVAYAVNKPKILAMIALLKLGLNLGANLIFIPLYGAVGAASATIVSNIIGGLLALVLIYQRVLHEKNMPGEPGIMTHDA